MVRIPVLPLDSPIHARILSDFKLFSSCKSNNFGDTTYENLHDRNALNHVVKGSLTLAMGKCLWFSVKLKVCQSSLSSP